MDKTTFQLNCATVIVSILIVGCGTLATLAIHRKFPPSKPQYVILAEQYMSKQPTEQPNDRAPTYTANVAAK